MRLTICHISDIHFGYENNSVLEKKEKICDAILQEALKNDVIFFLITGDIAQDGVGKEYEIALNFFTDIQSVLERKKGMKVFFFFVPGNHDCDFTNDARNQDDDLRREKIIGSKKIITAEKTEYYIEALCEKQKDYRDFIELFTYNETEDVKIIQKECSKLLLKYEIFIDGKKIVINALNSAWLTEKHEKPGHLFFPENEFKKIDKEDDLIITMYHHPSNWMHPNDRNEFNRWVMNKSDLVYVGHEHVGRNEDVTTRDTVYHAQYGEVLQERGYPDSSGFIINYIEQDEKSTVVYKWNEEQKIYIGTNTNPVKLCLEEIKYLAYCKEYQEYLQTTDIRISHPKKTKVTVRDLYVYPDVEAYDTNRNNYEVSKDSKTVKGDNLIGYVLKQKKISFAGGTRTGKTALAKNLAMDLLEKGKFCIVIDCSELKLVTNKNLKTAENKSISVAYGKEYAGKYKQLDLSRKVLLLDNFEKIRDSDSRGEILEYFDNFYDYILTFSNTTFGIELLEESLQKEKRVFKHCSINELGYRGRNQLITKWYSLNEGGEAIVDDEIKNKVSEAMSTINILKGDGYMPCIPTHILIILQQLEFSMDGNTQERSNYGYLYEFLITKSILEMNQKCEYTHKDIAFGLLTTVAERMLQENTNVISVDAYKQIVYKYNLDFQTDANSDLYLSEFTDVELLNCKEGQITFGYPYIHYYFTAKYLANNIAEVWIRDKIEEMSQKLYEEEYGDIMIFLCHLSKDNYIIEKVLKNAKNVLNTREVFDFREHKAINMSFDEYLETDVLLETNRDKRENEILDSQDRLERESKRDARRTSKEHRVEEIYNLDNAFKTIEVMGQILKNYPGTIKAPVKNELLETTFNLGMRTLTYTSDILYGGIEDIFEEIRKRLQPKPTMVEMQQIQKLTRKLNSSMDNIFGLVTYGMIRKLAESIANKALMPVISSSKLSKQVAYQLVKDSVDLNEFGIIAVDLVIKEYDEYKESGNIFAAKLLRLLVFDYYYVYGSKDFKSQQRIWAKMEFGNKERVLALQADNKN